MSDSMPITEEELQAWERWQPDIKPQWEDRARALIREVRRLNALVSTSERFRTEDAFEHNDDLVSATRAARMATLAADRLQVERDAALAEVARLKEALSETCCYGDER